MCVLAGAISTAVTAGNTSRCPFQYNLSHQDFRNLLVMNTIQARGTVCLGCSKNEKRIDSHPYGEGILKSSMSFLLKKPRNEIEQLKVIWRSDLQSLKVTAARCTYRFKREAFCGACDHSTSDWENALASGFGQKSIEVRHFGNALEPTLLVQMLRGAILSIDIPHYMECESCGQLIEAIGGIMLDLKRFHEKVCSELKLANNGPSKSAAMKEIKDAQKLLKAVFYVPDLQSCCNTHMIEYLLAVTLDDIGPIIYAQIPPYYWAVCSC